MTAVLERTRRLGADPLALSCWLAVILLGLGFAAFGAAWKGASGTLDVDEQVAYLVSGGLGGLAFIVAGSALLTVQLTRWLAALERHELEAVLHAARAALQQE